MTLERKFTNIETNTLTEEGTFTGYASRFGVKDQGGDVVMPGAFAESLKVRIPKLLSQHRSFDNPIGVFESVEEDKKGLLVRGRLVLDSERGRETHALMKAGALDAMSIGYRVEEAKETADGRLLKRLSLYEISIVTFPMLLEATIDDVKSSETRAKQIVEGALRDAGFSARQSKAGASGAALKLFGERDATDSAESARMIRDALKPKN